MNTIDEILNNFAAGIRSADYADNGYSAYVTFRAEAKAALTRREERIKVETRLTEQQICRNNWHGSTDRQFADLQNVRVEYLEQRLKTLDGEKE